MNPEVYEICEYLANNSDFTFDVPGANLIVGELIRNTNGVYARPVASPEPDRYTGNREINIDFWSRHPNSDIAYDWLKQVYNFFHQRIAYDLNSYHVYNTFCTGQIDDMDRDLENGKLWRLGVVFIVRNLIS